MIQLTNIPLPPSNNAIYASGRFNGITRRYLSKKAKEYVKEFRTWAVINREQLKHLAEFLENNDSVSIFINYTTQWKNKNGSLKKKDVMNYDKLMIDQLFSSIGQDDSKITSAVLQKIHSDDAEFVRIVIGGDVFKE